MALNHFASQVKQNQANATAKKAIDKAITSAGASRKSGHVETVPANPAKPGFAKKPEVDAAPSAKIEAAQSVAATPPKQNLNPALKDVPLSWSDQQMLCAMSAMQIRYGRPAEAIPYLMMVRKINPKNVECARLLALSFMRLERWQEAEAMVEEYDFLQKSNQTGVMDGLILLYRSLVSYKTNKFTDAKSWFGKFRKFNKVS